jgi:hypothetical protein
MMAVAAMSKQAQAQGERGFYAALFKGDVIEEVKPIPRRKVLQATKEFAEKVLSGEIRSYYFSVEGE